MKRIVVIGGGGAGTGTATNAIQFDRSLDVTLITEFEDIAYSPCGIPYVFGRDIKKFDGIKIGIKDENDLMRPAALHGVIDEIRVYDRVLNTDEINLLYKNSEI